MTTSAQVKKTAKAADAVKLSPRELWEQRNEEANERLQAIAASVTQREWLIITRTLDRNRQQIGSDTGLTLLAMGWVKEKREHGGASWDRLLDLTDEQLEELHGFPAGDGTDLPTTVDGDDD